MRVQMMNQEMEEARRHINEVLDNRAKILTNNIAYTEVDSYRKEGREAEIEMIRNALMERFSE